MFNFCLIFPVPGSPPQNFDATANSPRSIGLSWSPPSPEELNGILTGYVISVAGLETRQTFQLNVSAQTTTYTISNARPYTTYSLVIAAVNNAGMGPFSTEIEERTPEDCKHTVCISVPSTEISVLFV